VVIFIVAAFAEANRTPFDLAEGESELVAGFHVEYSSMKFALFFMGEYVAMFVSSAIIVTLYFGGYQIPWFSTQTLIEYAKPLHHPDHADAAGLSPSSLPAGSKRTTAATMTVPTIPGLQEAKVYIKGLWGLVASDRRLSCSSISSPSPAVWPIGYW
jgi:NADH-quinone oxidoreductase subunit H